MRNQTRDAGGGRRRLLLAALVVQISVPAAAMAAGVPSKFGFHMYSSSPGLVVSVLDDDGAPLPVDLSRWVANNRPEIDWTDVLPEQICAGTPAAASVTVRSAGRERTLRCGD